MKSKKKILQIGNYPPPMCGWAIQTKFVTGPEQVDGPTKWVPLLPCGPPI